ncbi:MAG: HAD family phosphatase [Anaerolineales bacterium]
MVFIKSIYYHFIGKIFPGGTITPMPFPKAVLWDMDGVLADTSPLHFATWEQILTRLGIPFNKQKFQYIYGLKNHDLLPYLTGKPLDPQWVESVAAQKELAFRQALPGHLLPLPGVMDWLQSFHLHGCKQAVASSAPPENVEALVEELGIRKYFSALVTPGNLPGKPDPAVFLLAANQLSESPQNCLILEDSIPGIAVARQANINRLAVTTINPPEALSGADLVVKTLAHLSIEQVDSLI